MAFKSLQCPNCGGQIDDFDETTKIGKCPFCATVIRDVQEQQKLFEVKLSGPIRVEGVENREDALQRIRDFLTVGEREKAYAALEEFVDRFPGCFEGWEAMFAYVMEELGVWKPTTWGKDMVHSAPISTLRKFASTDDAYSKLRQSGENCLEKMERTAGNREERARLDSARNRFAGRLEQIQSEISSIVGEQKKYLDDEVDHYLRHEYPQLNWNLQSKLVEAKKAAEAEDQANNKLTRFMSEQNNALSVKERGVRVPLIIGGLVVGFFGIGTLTNNANAALAAGPLTAIALLIIEVVRVNKAAYEAEVLEVDIKQVKKSLDELHNNTKTLEAEAAEAKDALQRGSQRTKKMKSLIR